MFYEEGFSGYIIFRGAIYPSLDIPKGTKNLPQKTKQNRFKLCKKGLFDF